MPGKILIVDDVATNRIVMKVKLASAFYHIVQAATGTEALQMAREGQPDLIVLDARLPDIDGISVCQRLKSDPATRGIAIIMVSAAHDPMLRLAAMRAGADDFMDKPLDEVVLLARVRSLMRSRETEEELHLRDMTCRDLGFSEAPAPFDGPGTVAIVAARPDGAVVWKHALAEQLQDRLVVLGPQEVLAATASQPVPDVFVIAADLNGPGAGLRLMSELRSRMLTRHAAICVVTDPEARETAAMALDLGANDVMSTGMAPEELALRIRSQLQSKRNGDRLRASVADGLRLAVIDPLTGLYNRRYALPHVARIAARAGETGRSFALMVLDLDRFKSVNDTWGHAAGDVVLVEVASRIRANLRSVDLVARIGGEEFLVALPDTALDAARAAAERLRAAVEAGPIGLPGGAGEVRITLSIGLAMGAARRGAIYPIDEIMDLADRALLGSKSEGRNLVTVSRTAA